MFFLFRQKEPIRPAGGPPLRLFVRQCDHARLAQKWSANLQAGRTLKTMLSRPNSNQDDNIRTGRAGTWAQKLNLWEPTPPNVTERSTNFRGVFRYLLNQNLFDTSHINLFVEDWASERSTIFQGLNNIQQRPQVAEQRPSSRRIR